MDATRAFNARYGAGYDLELAEFLGSPASAAFFEDAIIKHLDGLLKKRERYSRLTLKYKLVAGCRRRAPAFESGVRKVMKFLRKMVGGTRIKLVTPYDVNLVLYR